jgi:hypothetical protein
MLLKNHSVDAEIKIICGKPPRAEEVILKNKGGWETSLRSAGSRLFLVKQFPSDGCWLDDDNEVISQTIEQIVLSIESDDFTSKPSHGHHKGRRWLIQSLLENVKSESIPEKWHNVVGVVSIDVEMSSKGKEISFPIPNRSLCPLQGRPLLLSALVDEDNSLILDLANSIIYRLEKYWGCASDGNNLEAELSQSRKITHELIHNQDGQPHRFPKDEWVPPKTQKQLSEWLEDFNPLIGEPNDLIRTIYAKKSHGDLWCDNLIFSIKDSHVESYPIDPFHMVYRHNGNIKYVEYPNSNRNGGTIYLKSRYCFEHDEDPIPNPLHDIGQLIASILISLPFQDTQSSPLKGKSSEREKNRIMTKNMQMLRESLIESFTDESQGNDVMRNIHTFLDVMYELVEDMITGNVSKKYQDEVRENMTLMLVDRIFFFSGFILNELKSVNDDARRDEFVSYVVNILNVISQQNIVEE